jgi:hypothetical protein
MIDLIQYAEVKSYFGCYELEAVARPYLRPSAIGVGFFLAWWAHRTFERWMGWDRRAGADRRIP